MRASRPIVPVPVGDTGGYQPTRARPVRVRARSLSADTHFEPHRHAWAQLAYCSRGVLQVTAQRGATTHEETTFIVPPSRAVWVAPGARHSVHVVESADFRTLYIHASATPAAWEGCRVVVVSPLLRELVAALDTPRLARPREALMASLVLDELRAAAEQDLGVPLPPPGGDKRLRALCEAALREPGRRTRLADWAADIGASERTLARLFQAELRMGWQQWRQQAVLAHALPLLARGAPVSDVAAATGYASDSAFSAMFRAAMGQPPRRFQPRATAVAKPSYTTDQLAPTAELGPAVPNPDVPRRRSGLHRRRTRPMAGSQDSQEGTHPQAHGAGSQSPGGRSGEGAASAMQQMIADTERQQREEPGEHDAGGSHPQ